MLCFRATGYLTYPGTPGGACSRQGHFYQTASCGILRPAAQRVSRRTASHLSFSGVLGNNTFPGFGEHAGKIDYPINRASKIQQAPDSNCLYPGGMFLPPLLFLCTVAGTAHPGYTSVRASSQQLILDFCSWRRTEPYWSG